MDCLEPNPESLDEVEDSPLGPILGGVSFMCPWFVYGV